MKITIQEAVAILPKLYVLSEKAKNDELANATAKLVRELESIKTTYQLSNFECDLIKYSFSNYDEKTLKPENPKKRKTYKRREKKL